jgi:hypothetical protein
VDSATNCTATSGQLAAATSAPRLSVAFSPGSSCIDVAIDAWPMEALKDQFTFGILL